MGVPHRLRGTGQARHRALCSIVLQLGQNLLNAAAVKGREQIALGMSFSVGLAIDRFAEASRLTHFYFPLVSDTEPPLVFAAVGNSFFGSRAACQALANRARLRLGSGDFDGFRADALAVARIARLATARPLLIDRLVSYGCDAIATELFTHAATSERPARVARSGAWPSKDWSSCQARMAAAR